MKTFGLACVVDSHCSQLISFVSRQNWAWKCSENGVWFSTLTKPAGRWVPILTLCRIVSELPLFVATFYVKLNIPGLNTPLDLLHFDQRLTNHFGISATIL